MRSAPASSRRYANRDYTSLGISLASLAEVYYYRDIPELPASSDMDFSENSKHYFPCFAQVFRSATPSYERTLKTMPFSALDFSVPALLALPSICHSSSDIGNAVAKIFTSLGQAAELPKGLHGRYDVRQCHSSEFRDVLSPRLSCSNKIVATGYISCSGTELDSSTLYSGEDLSIFEQSCT